MSALSDECVNYTKQEFILYHIPYCLHKRFRHTEALLSIRVVGSLLKFWFPCTSKGQTLLPRVCKDMYNLGPANVHFSCTLGSRAFL